MKLKRILVAVITGTLLWGGYLSYRAYTNLVTLNVRNMDVRRVVSKLEWQTWERIILNTNVSGHVTLDVHNVPLEEVLNIVSLQTSARWTSFYPIYSTSDSMSKFKKVVQGVLPPVGSGWLNLQKTPIWQLSGANGFGNILRSENKVVSAQIQNKDLDFAALALSRFSQARVVPEDGTRGTINLKLDEVPFRKAVAQVAKQVHRKWDQVYAIQPLHVATVVRKESGDAEVTTSQAPPATAALPDFTTDQTNGPAQQAMEAFLSTMTPAERTKAQEQIAAMQQLNSLPPAERQQRMQEMTAQAKQASQADLLSRIQNRLKNGTPDQRVAHDRSQVQKKNRGNQKQ